MISEQYLISEHLSELIIKLEFYKKTPLGSCLSAKFF